MIVVEKYRIWYWDGKLSRAYQRTAKAAESRGEAETARALSELDKQQAQLEEMRLLYLQTKLLRRARRLLLPIPSYERDESGKYKNFIESRTLFKTISPVLMKADVMVKFREDIRRETSARRDFVLGYITPLVTIMTELSESLEHSPDCLPSCCRRDRTRVGSFLIRARSRRRVAPRRNPRKPCIEPPTRSDRAQPAPKCSPLTTAVASADSFAPNAR